jgi:hypothetical protein
MKHGNHTSRLLAVGLTIACMATLVLAQDAPDNSTADKERAAIEETRRIYTEKLDAQAKLCEHKFAVTGCLALVRSERLGMEAQLKQREEILNDAQRQQRAQEQLERSREKARAHAQKMESPPAVSEPRSSSPKAPPKPGDLVLPRSAPAPQFTEQERSANARDYMQKQAQANAKREELAKKIKDKGPSSAPSLPTPR